MNEFLEFFSSCNLLYYGLNYMKKEYQKIIYTFLGIWVIFFIFILTTCVELYEPKIDKYDNVLVVDGSLSTLPGSAEIVLSHSYPYNNHFGLDYISGATVFLKDIKGNSWEFFENENVGHYYHPDSTFKGETGNQYKITVISEEGKEYESSFQEVLAPVDIDDLWFDYATNDKGEKTSVQIKINVENKRNEATNFLWKYEEVWRFEVPFETMYVPNSKVCYRKVVQPVFYVKSTILSKSNSLHDHTLYSIDNSTNRLYIKYSTLIIQHVISDENYKFYEKLKEINEDQGSLYDKIPTTLQGNITCVSQPNELVLGNFLVSGATSKRMFISKNELSGSLNITSGFEDCEEETLGIRSNKHRLDSLRKAGWEKMDSSYSVINNESVISVSSRAECFNCQLIGTPNKPDFWEE